jgi:D-lactate dehydrogenase (cytochrome)
VIYPFALHFSVEHETRLQADTHAHIQGSMLPSTPTANNKPRVTEAISKLQQAFPEKGYIITDPAALRVYGSSENSYHGDAPHSVIVRRGSLKFYPSFEFVC